MAREDWERRSQEIAEEARAKHPERKTLCGAFLAEMRSTQDLDRLRILVHLFWVRECRRGLRQLEGMIDRLLQFPIEFSSPERRLLGLLFFAVADMDTPASHEVMCRVLRENEQPEVRADVLEAMTRESKMFDIDLVLRFVSAEVHVSELLSALYTLHYIYANERPAECRKRVGPLLKHPDPWVRAYAVGLLSQRLQNEDLILPLAEDPEQIVRESVAEALELMDTLEDD